MRSIVALSLAASAAMSLPGIAAAGSGPSVTIYSHDLGLIRETHTVRFAGGRDTLRIEGVPGRLDFSSLRLVPAGGARLERLAWRPGASDGDALLDRIRGARVRVRARGDRVTEGTLLALDPAWLVVREDGGAVTSLARAAVEDVRSAVAPAGVAPRAAVEAVLAGARAGEGAVELTYLTGGLTWSAEHVLVRRGEGAGTWSSTVTVENATGREFADADLGLVAGDPARDAGGPVQLARAPMMMMADGAAAGKRELTEQDFSEYHLYTLPAPATLRDRETQSLVLLEPRPVALASRYRYRADAGAGVRLRLELRDVKDDGLGVPIPAGRVRTYEADAAGNLRFIGETALGHVAAGERFTVDVGRAFDLVAERKLTGDRRISDREREQSVEIALRDRKRTAVTITVEESLSGDWEIAQSSLPWTRVDAATARFEVPVPAGGEVTLRYTARLRW